MRTNRMQWKRETGRIAGLLMLVMAAACSGDGPTGPGGGTGNPPPPAAKTVASVEVAPEAIVLQINETRQIWATPLAADRTPLTDRAVQWSTSDSAVAFVTAHGTVWARSVGSVTLTATVEGKQGQARVEVSPPPPPPAVAYVRITPGEVTMSEDPATWKLTARTYAADGAELTGRAVAWASGDSARLRVYEGGQLAPHGAGVVTVTATSEGKQAAVRVTIPEWQKALALKGAAGLPLPAPFDAGTYVDDRGVTHTVRRVVTDGALRFSFTGGRYEQRLTVQTYQDGVLVGTDAYFDRGTYLYDMWEGTQVFTSTLFSGMTFRATPAGDGGLAVTQRIRGEGAPATFLFGKR